MSHVMTTGPGKPGEHLELVPLSCTSLISKSLAAAFGLPIFTDSHVAPQTRPYLPIADQQEGHRPDNQGFVSLPSTEEQHKSTSATSSGKRRRAGSTRQHQTADTNNQEGEQQQPVQTSLPQEQKQDIPCISNGTASLPTNTTATTTTAHPQQQHHQQQAMPAMSDQNGSFGSQGPSTSYMTAHTHPLHNMPMHPMAAAYHHHLQLQQQFPGSGMMHPSFQQGQNPYMQYPGFNPLMGPSYMSGPPSYSSHGYRGPPGRVTNNGMSADGTEGDLDDARAIKRPRLVWTAQLHKRFEDAITKLGDKKAVPKNIMQEMNVDGLTRENVASHLQKYRLQKQVRPDDPSGLLPPGTISGEGVPDSLQVVE